MEKILDVKNLQVSFNTYAGEVRAVRDVSFHVDRGETLCFVGESGCGKTVTAKAIMRLLPKGQAEIKQGSEIIFDGKNMLEMSNKELQAYRGGDISTIFQDPYSALDPRMTIAESISEGTDIHMNYSEKEKQEKVNELLAQVNLTEDYANRFVHELSGGQRQRIGIARALAVIISQMIKAARLRRVAFLSVIWYDI